MNKQYFNINRNHVRRSIPNKSDLSSDKNHNLITRNSDLEIQLLHFYWVKTCTHLFNLHLHLYQTVLGYQSTLKKYCVFAVINIE